MTSTPKQIVVTGGVGFIGSNLVRALIETGHTVRVFDNLDAGLPVYLEPLSVEIIEGDIRNPDELTAAFAGADAVFHLAAYGNVIDSIEDPVTNFEVNARGTLNALRAAVDNGVGRFVFSSTGGALMGNTPPPVNEKSVPKPISPYGASKLACEGYLSAFANSYGLHTVMFRFANVYGPNSAHKKGVINRYLVALERGEPLVVYGDGVRDFIYVDDLVSGLMLGLGDAARPGDVFHLSTNEGVKVADLARRMVELRGGDPTRIQAEPGRTGEVAENFADNTLARTQLGFEIRTPLDVGLATTLQWFDEHRALWEHRDL